MSNREFVEWIDLCLEENQIILAVKEIRSFLGVWSIREAKNIQANWDIFRLGLL